MMENDRNWRYSSNDSLNSKNNLKEFDPEKNLIVNYLPTAFTQNDLNSLFSEIGEVKNCRLMKNTMTGVSLGYGFVELVTKEDAVKSITKIDGIQIDGKTIKVSFARQSGPDIKESNVYIAGLPLWVNESKLLSLFSPFGTVITHKLLLTPEGTTRGVGFVRFSLKSEADEAIQNMAGKLLPEAKDALTVKLAMPPASKQQYHGLVGNGPSISSIAGKNNRFSPLASSNPMLLNKQLVASHTLTINTNQSSTINPIVQARQNLGGQIHSLYVYGLQPSHTELTLYELFFFFVAIINVKLIRDSSRPDSPCKGYGFVNYKNFDEADIAMKTMNGCPFEGKHLQVSFKSNPTNASNTPQLVHALSQIH